MLALSALAACGGSGEGEEVRGNAAAAAAGESAGTDAEIAADAALADEAAQAEAEDAAIGGNMSANDVSAANLQ